MSTPHGSPAPPQSVTVLGGFEIVRKLGQGGMGAVYLARQASMDREVALKVLAPRLAKNKEFVERFLREARAAARLSHQNIVQAIDAGLASGYYYFAMEYVDGPNLRQVLDRDGPLPEDRALELTLKVAAALHHAHAVANIIHRDIKPENILIAPDGTPKVTDLGLAREVDQDDASLTRVGVTLGTPNYISPEQVRGERDLDGRTDVYSLGATLFHLVAGAPPYRGGTPAEVMAKHLSDPIPDARALNGRVSAGTAAIIRKAMAKDREQRYPTAKALADDIRRVVAGGAPTAITDLTARRPVMARQAPPVARRRRTAPRQAWPYVAAGAMLVLAALIAAFVVVAWPRPEAEPNVGRLPGLPPTDPTPVPVSEPKRIEPPPELPPELRTPTAAEQAAEQIKAADALFARLSEETGALAKTGDYDAALRLWDSVPRELADLLAARASVAKARLRAEAQDLIGGAVSAAEKLAGDQEYEKALAALDPLRNVKYQPLAASVEALRSRLQAGLKKKEDDEQARALAAAKEEKMKTLLDKNAELHQTYLGRVNDIEKQDLAAQSKKSTRDRAALDREIRDAESRVRDVEEQLRDLREKFERRRPPFRPGMGEKSRRLFEDMGRERGTLAGLKVKLFQLDLANRAEQARISGAATKRRWQLKAVHDRNRTALGRGQALTVEQMTAAYEAALKP